MSWSVPKWPSLHFRCSMSITSWWWWMTFVVLRSQRVLGGPFCVTETVQASSLLSGASKTGSLSVPHQVCSVKCYPFITSYFISHQQCQKVRNGSELHHSCVLSPSLPGFICSLDLPLLLPFCPLFPHLITYRIPGSRLWLGRLPETVRGRGSSPALLPNCKSTSVLSLLYQVHAGQASV